MVSLSKAPPPPAHNNAQLTHFGTHASQQKPWLGVTRPNPSVRYLDRYIRPTEDNIAFVEDIQSGLDVLKKQDYVTAGILFNRASEKLLALVRTKGSESTEDSKLLKATDTIRRLKRITRWFQTGPNHLSERVKSDAGRPG
jgi:hypothetical protein